MKRMVAMLMTFVMSSCLVTGCGQSADDKKIGVLPDNEVVTMCPYDTEKPTVVLSICDNLDQNRMKEILQKQFPDLSIIVRHGGEAALDIPNGVGDIYLYQTAELSEEIESYLMDLSVLDCSAKYYATSLQQCVSSHDGKQYQLPGPATITGIVYNKTMFAENGWEVPHGKTEFKELCHTIQDSGIVERAFLPTFKFTINTLSFAELFNQSNLFATLDYYAWQDDYAKGVAGISADKILKPMIDVYQEFLDEGIIQLSDFTVSPPDRSAALYERRSAMSIETQQVQKMGIDAGSTDEFGMFPFYSNDNEDSGYIMGTPIANISVNKRLSEEENKEKLDNVIRVVDFLSTAEGIAVFADTTGLVIPQIKDYNMDYFESDVLTECESAIAAGRIAPLSPYYVGGESQSKKTFDAVINAVLDTSRHSNPVTEDDSILSYEDAVQYMDNINQGLRSGTGFEIESVYATATEKFTVLETSEYYAQMFMERADADVGLCLSMGYTHGNLSSIPKGDLIKTTASSVNTMNHVKLLDNFHRGINRDENDKKLTKLSMTGSQILQALEYPDCNEKGVFEGYFVPAGLKVEFAPWAEEGSRFLSVTLPDGSALEPDKLYTVAAWNYTVSEEYITEVLETYDDTFQELLAAQLTKDKEIAPFKDGRVVLNWDVRTKTE